MRPLAAAARLSLSMAAVAAMVALASGPAALAQDASDDAGTPTAAYVVDILAGTTSGQVELDGAALAPQGDGAYWFSDGTDVITIRLDAAGADTAMPLLTLVHVAGDATSDAIDVTSWAPLDLMVPAVVRTPAEAAEAFMAWIITQNAQAPAR